MTTDKVGTINSQLIVAREKRAQLQLKVDAARRVSEGATAGGLTGYDSAVLSGIRRKANPRATARRYAAYDRESALAVLLVAAEREVVILDNRLSHAVSEANRVRFNRADVMGAQLIRTELGWAKVRRVNAKTVSVDSGYSWADLIPFDDVLEVRFA